MIPNTQLKIKKQEAKAFYLSNMEPPFPTMQSKSKNSARILTWKYKLEVGFRKGIVLVFNPNQYTEEKTYQLVFSKQSMSLKRVD